MVLRFLPNWEGTHDPTPIRCLPSRPHLLRTCVDGMPWEEGTDAGLLLPRVSTHGARLASVYLYEVVHAFCAFTFEDIHGDHIKI
jgi:hypothetical protein